MEDIRSKTHKDTNWNQIQKEVYGDSQKLVRWLYSAVLIKAVYQNLWQIKLKVTHDTPPR